MPGYYGFTFPCGTTFWVAPWHIGLVLAALEPLRMMEG